MFFFLEQPFLFKANAGNEGQVPSESGKQLKATGKVKISPLCPVLRRLQIVLKSLKSENAISPAALVNIIRNIAEGIKINQQDLYSKILTTDLVTPNIYISCFVWDVKIGYKLVQVEVFKGVREESIQNKEQQQFGYLVA